MNQLQRSYEILGLGPGASLAAVRRAYRGLVRTWHPDRFTDNPALQLTAQEKLKQVNEAYQQVLAALSAPPRRQPPTVKAAPPPPAPPTASPQPAGETAPPPPRPAPVVTNFFAFWPNILFLLFLIATIRFVFLRYGAAPAGFAYLLQMTLLPLAFSLACNSRLGDKRSLWVAYVLAVVLFGALVGLDALTFKKELQEAGITRYSSGGEGGSGSLSGGGLPMPESREPLTAPERRPPAGPLAPAPPQVMAPSAPTPPVSPVVPGSR